MVKIHPTAIISPQAQIGTGVEIGPYAIIEGKVEIAQNTVIAGHTVIYGDTQIGQNCFIGSFSSLGLPPQDNDYQGEDTKLIIGNNVQVREYCSLNKGSIKGSGVTKVDDNCYLMSYCHLKWYNILKNGSRL